MTSPNQYPQLPPGVAPVVAGIAGEFAAIRQGAEEAGRRSPPVITFPPFPPFPPPQVIPPSSPPETQSTLAPGFGWVNYGGGYQQLGYELIGTRVFLRGLISNTTAITNGGPSIMFGMPAGLRPAVTEIFPVMAGTNVAYRVDVNSDGTATLIGNLALSNYVSLSGITYSTLA